MKKKSRTKPVLRNRLSIGLIVLGIACTLCALFNIWDNNNYSASEDYSKERVDLTPVSTLPPMDAFPTEGEVIGKLTIPALDQVLPIIEGTGTDELKEGVGHFTQSVMPGEIDNCVLSGHRDTVFSELGELVIGDQLIVETSTGIFTYEIQNTKIVNKDDKTVIVPTDHGVLTVTTCYPFHYIGAAPERYIVIADLVNGD